MQEDPKVSFGLYVTNQKSVHFCFLFLVSENRKDFLDLGVRNMDVAGDF